MGTVWERGRTHNRRHNCESQQMNSHEKLICVDVDSKSNLIIFRSYAVVLVIAGKAQKYPNSYSLIRNTTA